MRPARARPSPCRDRALAGRPARPAAGARGTGASSDGARCRIRSTGWMTTSRPPPGGAASQGGATVTRPTLIRVRCFCESRGPVHLFDRRQRHVQPELAELGAQVRRRPAGRACGSVRNTRHVGLSVGAGFVNRRRRRDRRARAATRSGRFGRSRRAEGNRRSSAGISRVTISRRCPSHARRCCGRPDPRRFWWA